MQTTWLFCELNHSWIRINMQVNKSCVLGEDWVIKIKISETGNLLTELISSIYVQQNKLFWMCRQCDLLLGPESKFTLPCIKLKKTCYDGDYWRVLSSLDWLHMIKLITNIVLHFRTFFIFKTFQFIRQHIGHSVCVDDQAAAYSDKLFRHEPGCRWLVGRNICDATSSRSSFNWWVAKLPFQIDIDIRSEIIAGKGWFNVVVNYIARKLSPQLQI